METIHRGSIRYQGDAGLRGREDWSITRSADGARTLSAHCRMFDSGIERWVVHALGQAGDPIRSFISHRTGGKFLGEGWFLFFPGVLVGRALLRDGGQIEQSVTIDGQLDYFVPHAVAADSWITTCYDVSRGGWQEVRHGFTSSLLPDGSTGPLIEQHYGLRILLVGEESVSVPAGTYPTRHFVVCPQRGVEEHLWVSTDETQMLIRLRSDRLGTTYLLEDHRVEAVWT